MIEIRVPATTANMGVGFDCLGMAVSLYATFCVALSDKLIISGCEKRYQNESNLVWLSYCHTLKKYDIPTSPVSLVIESDIPLARGLGSSATCVVAGVVAANELYNLNLSKQDILLVCTEIEGHPDNVAPAVLGGCVASYKINTDILIKKYNVHSDYVFVALIPEVEVSTEQARKVLPKAIEFEDAVSNEAKLVFFLEALETGKTNHLNTLLDDSLHEPYRKELIPEYDKIKKVISELSGYSFISGSGSTMLGIFKENIDLDLLEKEVKKLSSGWKVVSLSVDRKGVILC